MLNNYYLEIVYAKQLLFGNSLCYDLRKNSLYIEYTAGV